MQVSNGFVPMYGAYYVPQRQVVGYQEKPVFVEAKKENNGTNTILKTVAIAALAVSALALLKGKGAAIKKFFTNAADDVVKAEAKTVDNGVKAGAKVIDDAVKVGSNAIDDVAKVASKPLAPLKKMHFSNIQEFRKAVKFDKTTGRAIVDGKAYSGIIEIGKGKKLRLKEGFIVRSKISDKAGVRVRTFDGKGNKNVNYILKEHGIENTSKVKIRKRQTKKGTLQTLNVYEGKPDEKGLKLEAFLHKNGFADRKVFDGKEWKKIRVAPSEMDDDMIKMQFKDVDFTCLKNLRESGKIK